MSINNLFLEYLFNTSLLSKSYKNQIIGDIIKNHLQSKEIMELLDSSKFNDELSVINKSKNIELYNKFTDKFDELTSINNELSNECGDYETGDIDAILSDLISMCKESYINYTNEKGETILFYLIREYYNHYEADGIHVEGRCYSFMDIFDAVILNKNFDIDIRNNKGIDAYTLCKKLGDYSDSEEGDEDEDNDYDRWDIICKMSYRKKLNKKKLSNK